MTFTDDKVVEAPAKPDDWDSWFEEMPEDDNEEAPAKTKAKRTSAVEDRFGGAQKITVGDVDLVISHEILWGGDKGDKGWAPATAALLRYRSALGLNSTDFELVQRLMIRDRGMGTWATVSARAIERDGGPKQNTFKSFADRLEAMGYLAKRVPPAGSREGRNDYNLDGLWKALALCVAVGSGKVSEEAGREAAKELGLAIPELKRNWQGGAKQERCGPRGMPEWKRVSTHHLSYPRLFEVVGGRKYFHDHEEYELYQEVVRRAQHDADWTEKIPYEWIQDCIQYAGSVQPMTLKNLLKFILNHDKLVDWQQRQRAWEKEKEEKEENGTGRRARQSPKRIEDETY